MDTNNWRPAQGGEPVMEAGNWRETLQQEARDRIVNKIMETLKRHLPFSGQELRKIAVWFEEKIYTAATSQSDYLRKICLKMLAMENKSQSTMPNSLPANPANNSKNPTDPEMDSSTLDDRGPGKNKKKWTENEDEKLIEAMFLAVNTGNHRADNGFKPGFYNVVERELNVKLPGAGIKAKPHIESRIKTMKRNFNIVYDMLYGPNTSGFGWDNDKKCVVAESPVWEEYIKSHKGAAMFKNKSLPHFEELLIIFGKDQATGKNAETAADVVEELDKEGAENETNTGDGLDENDASLSFAPTHNTRTSSEEYSSQRRRRSRSNDSFLEAIKEVGLAEGREIKESTSKLTEVMGYDVTVAAKRVRINDELLKLPTISMFERRKATLQIARDHETTDVFFTIADDEKEEWVKALLRGDI